MFLKIFFEKGDLEKLSADDKENMKNYPAYKEQKHEKLPSIHRTKAWKITQQTKNKSMKNNWAYKEKNEKLPSIQKNKIMKNYPAYKEQKHEKLPSKQRTKAWKITQHTENKSMKNNPAYKEH